MLSSTRISQLILLSLLLGPSSPALRAQWQIESAAPHDGAPAGLECRRVNLIAPSSGRSVTLDLVGFDARAHTFQVIDRAAPDEDLGRAMVRSGSLAGSNGGFFTPESQPLGLVIADGKSLHPLGASRLLTGVLVATRRDLRLLRNEEYRAPRDVFQALQAGPFLVDRSSPVPGLNGERSAARTAVATDGKFAWALISARSPTLAELGQILAQPGLLPGIAVSRALNLDGGSSCGLWIATAPSPIYLREFAAVRNFLGVAPRR